MFINNLFYPYFLIIFSFYSNIINIECSLLSRVKNPISIINSVSPLIEDNYDAVSRSTEYTINTIKETTKIINYQGRIKPLELPSDLLNQWYPSQDSTKSSDIYRLRPLYYETTEAKLPQTAYQVITAQNPTTIRQKTHITSQEILYKDVRENRLTEKLLNNENELNKNTKPSQSKQSYNRKYTYYFPKVNPKYNDEASDDVYQFLGISQSTETANRYKSMNSFALDYVKPRYKPIKSLALDYEEPTWKKRPTIRDKQYKTKGLGHHESSAKIGFKVNAFKEPLKIPYKASTQRLNNKSLSLAIILSSLEEFLEQSRANSSIKYLTESITTSPIYRNHTDTYFNLKDDYRLKLKTTKKSYDRLVTPADSRAYFVLKKPKEWVNKPLTEVNSRRAPTPRWKESFREGNDQKRSQATSLSYYISQVTPLQNYQPISRDTNEISEYKKESATTENSYLNKFYQKFRTLWQTKVRPHSTSAIPLLNHQPASTTSKYIFQWTFNDKEAAWPKLWLSITTERAIEVVSKKTNLLTFPTYFPWRSTSQNKTSTVETTLQIFSQQTTPKIIRENKDNPKCFECGLEDKEIPYYPTCFHVFNGGDYKFRYKRQKYKKKCSKPHRGGCFKRFVDLGDVYNERGCRAWPPAKGNTFASHRLEKLEVLLAEVDDGCIVSPHATLTPFSRAISLFARYHVCVCKGRYCNSGSTARTGILFVFFNILLSK